MNAFLTRMFLGLLFVSTGLALVFIGLASISTYRYRAAQAFILVGVIALVIAYLVVSP